MKLLLVGFKLSIGNELYMDILSKHLKGKDIEVDYCGDSNYIKKKANGYSIANGGNSAQMIIDTLNPLQWVKFFNVIRKGQYDIIFFISSHTLNNIAIVLSKLFTKTTVVSHIHDPIPHSGTSYGWIILFSQKLQSRLSDSIIVYGKKLKNIVSSEYNINKNKIYEIKHGVYRDNKYSYEDQEKKYISLLGRIDEYKGIDIFLKAIKQLDNQIDKKIKFVIGGKGDLSSYQSFIEELSDRIMIKNYLIPNDEFDEILEKSYALVLPYKDGTQTGNIQVAYYCGTPCIVSNVGSIPELVIENETGFIIKTNDINSLSESILKLLNSNYMDMGRNSFEYYEKYLRWDIIVDDLIKIFQEKK